MHVSFEKAVDALTDYMDNLVARVPNGAYKWCGIFGIAAIKFKPNLFMGKISPYLEMLGILHDGKVDIDMLKSVLDSAFEKVPTVTYLKFTFDSSDVDNLISRMRGFASSEEKLTQATAEVTEAVA